MKKLFTLAAAVLASMAMMAQTTIFSAAPATSSQIKQNAAGVYEFTSAQATVTGGHMFMAHNDGTSARKYTDKQSNQAVFTLDGSKSWFTIKLNVALQEGDTIIVEALTNGAGETNARGVWVALGSVVVRPSEAPACALLAQSETGKEFVAVKHIIQSTDDICGKDSISIWRATGNSTYFKSITIVRPEQKTVVSTVETLTNAKINGVALDPNFLSELTETGSVEVFNAYTTAPTVTFTKHVVITYDDESTKQSDVDVEVVAEALGSNQWTANITLNGADAYSITMQRAAAYTVTYKLADETVLGTEVVAAGGHLAEYAQYETMPLAEFQGWYTDAELTSEADLTAAVYADLTLYGKFVKAYAQSLNIEQLVLDESTGADIASILTNHGFAYAHIDALDSLNDLENKTNRNYAFLGLKLKTAGAYIQFHLQAGKTLAVKFGNLTNPIAVTIDGEAQANHTEGAFLLEAAEADRLIELKTTNKATVVLQQIMIGEPIVDVILPDPSAYLITIAESENGTVTANWDNKKYRTPVGATVTLNFTPAEGYIVMSCTVNGTEIHQSAPGAAITFEMPAEDVTIATTFSLPTAIDNAEAAVKAEKVIRDGQVLILRDGKIFNALGAEVK